jgi:hypothetical protein
MPIRKATKEEYEAMEKRRLSTRPKTHEEEIEEVMQFHANEHKNKQLVPKPKKIHPILSEQMDLLQKIQDKIRNKNKAETKKMIKMTMKDVEAVELPKKIKTGKVKKLLKEVESKAVEHEGIQLIKKIESKIKKGKDISDIKKMIKQSEETKPQYISTKEVEEAIKDMEYYMATTKLPKDAISHAKKKAKLLADKMKSDPAIIPIMRTQLLQYTYPIIHEFFMGYPDLFKELYPKTDVLQGKHKEFMEKFEKEEIKETKKKATKAKAVEAKANKAEEKEKFSKTKGLTPEEIKKYNQAKAYIARMVNKTSGKHKDLNLDKDDIASVAHELLEMGFTRMSEPLFLQAYKNYSE